MFFRKKIRGGCPHGSRRQLLAAQQAANKKKGSEKSTPAFKYIVADVASMGTVLEIAMNPPAGALPVASLT
jgi:hypothetical protein